MENIEHPLISIIVPIYNAESCLRQCLDSILAQTFTSIELLLVDDGSNDASANICDEYARRDSRISVFHQSNKGVSAARNVGLANATGEWLYFADADDLVLPDALEMLMKLTRPEIDIVMAGYSIVSGQSGFRESPKEHNSQDISFERALAEMYNPTDFIYQGFLWCKLFRSSIISQGHLKFNETIAYNEDRLFIVHFLCQSRNSVAYTTSPVYCHFVRSGSAMSTLKNSFNKKYASDFDAYVMMHDEIAKYAPNRKLMKLSRSGIASSYLQIHRMMLESRSFYPDIHARMFRMLIRKHALLQCFKLILMPFAVGLGLLIAPRLSIKFFQSLIGKSENSDPK